MTQLVRRSASIWLPPLVIATACFLAGVLTTPSTYSVTDGVLLAALYGLLALTVHLATLRLMLTGRVPGVLSAGLVVLMAAWHVREHLRPAGTVPSLDDWRALAAFLALVSLLAALYATVVLTLPPRWSRSALTRGSIIAGIGFVTLISTLYLTSNVLRWHLHRHNRIFGPLVYYVLADDVVDARARLWRDHQTTTSGSASPAPSRPASSAITDPRQNIVFIVVDTLRADALGTDSVHATMPLLGEQMRQALVFTDVQANSGWTKPSVASFFTGLLPEQHGAVSGSLLHDDSQTLAEILETGGYRTAAFVANSAVLSADQGFDQGFDVYRELTEPGQPYARGEAVTESVRTWLSTATAAAAGSSGAPLFLYVHYLDPHTPYLHGTSLNPAADRQATLEYNAELAYLDRHLTALLAEVRRVLPAPTAILLTSDHGEELGEHGERGHGHTLYGEVTKIPTVLWTGRAPDRGRLGARLEGRDLFDLSLVLAGSSTPNIRAWAASRSRTTRYASLYSSSYASVVYRLLRPRRAYVAMQGIEHEQYRLIWSALGPTYELYNLEQDPGELDNLADRLPDMVERLRGVLTAAIPETWAQIAPARRSEDALERLRGLGYVR